MNALFAQLQVLIAIARIDSLPARYAAQPTIIVASPFNVCTHAPIPGPGGVAGVELEPHPSRRNPNIVMAARFMLTPLVCSCGFVNAVDGHRRRSFRVRHTVGNEAVGARQML